MPLAVAVYCSSSENVGQEYFAEARTLGKLIATHGHSLVYGGCAIGLMGEVARAVSQNGGRVLGVIPETIHAKGLAYDACDELMVTPSMHERKLAMEERADAYVALPGGFGTLEEFVQVLTLKSLHYHKKPIVLINLNAFDVGEDVAALIGGTLLNLAARAVSAQSVVPPEQRQPVTLIVDEFHTIPWAD